MKGKNCEGCFEYNSGREINACLKLDNDECLSFCSVVAEKNGRHCPCSTCLVKMLECEELCDEWVDYYQFINGENPK